MSFKSGTFTHALATLAIDKRTEREKIALVEALLLSRMCANQTKAEAKFEEFQQLRHKIVRDHWNKAIHQVIINYNIPDKVKAKKDAQRSSEPLNRNTQGIQNGSMKPRKAESVRFNLDQNRYQFYSQPTDRIGSGKGQMQATELSAMGSQTGMCSLANVIYLIRPSHESNSPNFIMVEPVAVCR